MLHFVAVPSLDMSALGFMALFSVTRRDMWGGEGGVTEKGGGGEVQMFPGSDVCFWASFSLVFPRVTVPNTPRLSWMDINKNKINIKKCQRELEEGKSSCRL